MSHHNIVVPNVYHSDTMPNTNLPSIPLTFIDLFAGVGGFHMAFQGLAECQMASEMDLQARTTYFHVFKGVSPHLFSSNQAETAFDPSVETPRFNKDITTIDLVRDPNQVPDFDILCGGFPCQPFSNAGLRQGFADEKQRGNLFDNIEHIMKNKNPRALFLENVRGLQSHMSGSKKTLDIIKERIEAAGYELEVIPVRASDYGVPQHRPRVFIFGFKKGTGDLEFFLNNLPEKEPGYTETLAEILGAKSQVDGGREIAYTLRVGGRGSGLGNRYNWDTYLVDGLPMRITSDHGIKLMGFPDYFSFPEEVSEAARMKQLGNSVAVPAIRAFAEVLTKTLTRS
jgi:DNA (cytosine-5)-methyltransferase 1